jgi:hypothetical protein
MRVREVRPDRGEVIDVLADDRSRPAGLERRAGLAALGTRGLLVEILGALLELDDRLVNSVSSSSWRARISVIRA